MSVRSVVWTGIGIFAVIAFGIRLAAGPAPPLTAEQITEQKATSAQAAVEQKIASATRAAEKAAAEVAAAAKETEERAKDNVIWFSKETVRAMMRDPDFVQFGEITAYAMPKGGHIACGKVNAKNGFGGYSGYKRFVSAGVPELTGVEGSMAGFATVWKLCR